MSQDCCDRHKAITDYISYLNHVIYQLSRQIDMGVYTTKGTVRDARTMLSTTRKIRDELILLVAKFD